MFNSPKPIDVDVEKVKRLAKKIVPAVIIVIALVVLAVNSLYTITSGQEAVITRWGRYIETRNTPGLQLKIPFVDECNIVNVEGVRRLEFGMRTIGEDRYEEVPEEALMLTGNENLVVADWVIHYRVVNSYDYLFKVDDPEGTLRAISESAYRRVTASHPLDDILTDKKDAMQEEIKRDLQAICDKYEIGVLITTVQLQDASPPDPVKAAFLDVTSALEDKGTKKREAEGYKKAQIPLAQGKAASILNEARGYKDKRINEAKGAVARYKAIEKEYSANPEIMKTRLYFEMIREVLPQVEHIYFVDPDSGNTLQFLPLTGQTSTLPQGGAN